MAAGGDLVVLPVSIRVPACLGLVSSAEHTECSAQPGILELKTGLMFPLANSCM